ncbi:MAG: ribosome silencing factor [Lentisphaeraceae bacterium]|nr:ribosome silencing factor [Lentisphaeraceae bacterium]
MSSTKEQNEESKNLADKIVDICEDVKAVDIRVYDMTESSSVADFYIICTGNSEPHLKAIGDKLDREMRDADKAASVIDGGASSQWIVMDFHSAIVHVMHPDARSYYNLESLWSNGQVSPEKLPWECDEREILTSERPSRRPDF